MCRIRTKALLDMKPELYLLTYELPEYRRQIGAICMNTGTADITR
jgi:hypothetical protein